MNDQMKLAMDGQEDICIEYALVSGGNVEKHEPDYVTYNSSSGWYGRNCFIAPEKEEIDRIVKEILERGKQGYPTMITYAEELQQPNCAEVLEANGYSLFLTQNGMFFDLVNTPFDEEVCPDIVTIDTACINNPEYQKIRQKSISEDRVHEWTEVMTEGFKPEKELEYEVYDNLVKSENMIFYAFLKEGKIAGTSMILLRENNSGIHEVAVPPENRHKKIATKLVLRILQDLKKLGRTEVSLQASPFGYPVYSAIGFQETCHIHTWKTQ